MFRAIYPWFTRYPRLKAEHESLQQRQREIISIFQQLEKDCRVVVNRKIECLAGIPSWKDAARPVPAIAEKDQVYMAGKPNDFKPFNPRKGFKEFRNEWERKNNTVAPRLEKRQKEYEGIPEGETSEPKNSA